MNIERIVRQACEEKARLDSKPLPRPSTVREPSKNESERIFNYFGYHAFVCLHDRLYFDVCAKCRRTGADARVNLEAYAKKNGINL